MASGAAEVMYTTAEYGNPILFKYAPTSALPALVTLPVSPSEVTLHSTSKGGEDFVGGIKLHFPKTEPMDDEQASLVSALMNAFCKDHLWKEGSPTPGHGMVIDLASGKVYPGVKSIKQRLKDVESACGQIAALWPGITK
jgi:hypothetical protein